MNQSERMNQVESLKAIEVSRKLILSNNINGVVNSKAIILKLAAAGLHNMLFYYFLYAGLITTITKGKFQIQYAKFKGTKNEDILIAANDYMRKRNKAYKEQKHAKNDSSIAQLEYTPDECIVFLKRLGYKVYKPVNQFEEC